MCWENKYDELVQVRRLVFSLFIKRCCLPLLPSFLLTSFLKGSYHCHFDYINMIYTILVMDKTLLTILGKDYRQTNVIVFIIDNNFSEVYHLSI